METRNPSVRGGERTSQSESRLHIHLGVDTDNVTRSYILPPNVTTSFCSRQYGLWENNHEQSEDRKAKQVITQIRNNNG